MLNKILKSAFEHDRTPVVICDAEHKILYMNPVAKKHYARYGGEALIGKSLLGCHNEKSCEMIVKVISWFKSSKDNNMIFTSRNDKENKDVYMVALRDDNGDFIGYYEKHEYRNPETATLYDFSKSLF